MFVLDASVYVASVTEGDRYQEVSQQWLERCIRESQQLVAPNLLAVEVVGAVRRLTGSREVAVRAASRMRDDELVELLPLWRERARRAAEVAASTSVRGADAVYLALAQELDVPLVTLDRQQLQRGGAVADVRRPVKD